jgi:DNA mismatch repair protein MutL
MRKITLLPPEIFQKIAAGEVVERPFSVVKELVENSLDARAEEIKVELEEGGKSVIRVTDNGHGMSRDDALICFERHSTSKITVEDDLDQIHTLGFRGEALPSISAVSRVLLKTSTQNEKTGTQIEREGENVLQVSDIAFPKGTSIEVRDLFFNIPARKKFLRSERSELSQTARYLTQMAIAYTGVKFSLFHGSRKIFNYPQSGSLRERIYQVYGKSLLEKLLEVDYKTEEHQLSGYISQPSTGRRDRRQQFFFINKRLVRDSVLQAALNKACSPFMEKDYYAEAYLFLTVPFSEVDVNVHPAKTEVRFKNSGSIFQLVFGSVENAMLKSIGIKEVRPSPPLKEFPYPIPDEHRIPLIKEPGGQLSGGRDLYPQFEETREKKSYPHVLGQYLDTYIVAVDKGGVLIIDQHNAHERVLFERYEEIDKNRNWPKKLALLPLLIELSSPQVLSLENNRDLLEEAGFRAEPMGGQSYALREYPDIFSEGEAKDIFLSLLEDIKEEKIEDKKKRTLSMLACKTAVKAGQPLSFQKMNYLVEELFKTSNHSLCPHGRPVIVKLDRNAIEKGLKRA